MLGGGVGAARMTTGAEDYEHGSKAGFGVRGDESVESVLKRLGLTTIKPTLPTA